MLPVSDTLKKNTCWFRRLNGLSKVVTAYYLQYLLRSCDTEPKNKIMHIF